MGKLGQEMVCLLTARLNGRPFTIYKIRDRGVYWVENRIMTGKLSNFFLLVLALIAAGSKLMAGQSKKQPAVLKSGKDFYECGREYMRKQQWSAAITNFNEAIRLNPKDALALECRAGAYAMCGSSQMAIVDFSRAIQLDPTNGRIILNRSTAYVS